MAELDREDMMEAVTEGVRQAFAEAMTSGGFFDRPHELLVDAVRQGVESALWRVATNATDMPCSDFYDAIKAGAAAAMHRLSDSGQAG